MSNPLKKLPDGRHELDGKIVENEDIIEALINGAWVRGKYFVGSDFPTITSRSGDHPGAPLPIVTGTPCRWPAE